MYLSSATRPDIPFAVSKLSRFMSNPDSDHWHALERVMCYLKGTMSYGIHYSGHPAVLEGYSDTNYDPSVTLRKNKRIGIDQLRYSQIIGSLMYLSSATRPDISFAISKLSRFI